MAEVKVNVTGKAIIRALNTPGGDVYEWRDRVTAAIRSEAIATSPVNDPANAEHRGGVVGTYLNSWEPWDRRGSSGHHVMGRVMNNADHAVYVEFGRTGSSKLQIFSWTEWGPGVYRVGGPAKRKLKSGAILTKRQQAFNERAEAYNRGVDRLPERRGSRTAMRAGQHILGKAAQRVMAGEGIAVSLY